MRIHPNWVIKSWLASDPVAVYGRKLNAVKREPAQRTFIWLARAGKPSGSSRLQRFTKNAAVHWPRRKALQNVTISRAFAFNLHRRPHRRRRCCPHGELAIPDTC